jgi:hypothetical protein
MSDEPKTSSLVDHFAQGNGDGPDKGNVPRLLRRVAETIEELGPVQVMDLVLHMEMDDDGNDDPQITVYYYRKDTPDPPLRLLN